jgi:hypothetical protein
MRVALATSPGHPGRGNEDFVAAAPGVVVLLDGAGIRGAEDICRHGTAWYAHSLGGSLLSRLTRDGDADLAACLADAIDEIARRHRHTCDLANPSSPQATIAVARVAGDRVDHLVLADSYVVLDAGTGPQVRTDEREVLVRQACTAPLEGMAEGSAEYDEMLPSVIEAFRAHRNQPGGYWIAKDDPAAAAEAVTGSTPRAGLRGLALLSNGASRIVDPYGLASWADVVEMLRGVGPDELVRRVREAEAGPVPGAADDASAAYVDLRD